MKVNFSRSFAQKLVHFPNADQKKIFDFIEYVELYGFDGLTGRNKSSDHVPKDDPHWSIKVSYAQQHRLWHYHIGIPNYALASNGEQVSEYILHYMRFEDSIKLVSLSYHPPFELPTLAEIV